MPLSLNPRPIVRLWLLADILLGRDLHPLLPRKRTLALTPLSNRAALRALIGNPTRYFALWAVFWPVQAYFGVPCYTGAKRLEIGPCWLLSGCYRK